MRILRTRLELVGEKGLHLILGWKEFEDRISKTREI